MINKKEFDLIVIGGGPGGYVAAIRASQLGLSVLCVEKRKSLGGTCLNVGCIPSKTLLHSSHLYDLSKKHFKKLGINIDGKINLDLEKMMHNKEQIVRKLTGGIDSLFKKNKVTYLQGSAKIVDGNSVEIDNTIFQAKTILISTGSVPSDVKNIGSASKVGNVSESISTPSYWSLHSCSNSLSCSSGDLYSLFLRGCKESIDLYL